MKDVKNNKEELNELFRKSGLSLIATGTVFFFFGVSWQIAFLSIVMGSALTSYSFGHKFFFEVFLIAIFLGGISNQIVQPLFSPRIEKISIEPQHIRSIEDVGYQISRVNYQIAAPLFPFKKEIKLEVPHMRYGGNGGTIELIANYKEYSPYITINEFYNDTFNNFIKTDELTAKIETEAFHTKNLEVNVFIREQMPDRQNNLANPDYFWWTYNSLTPLSDCDVMTHYPKEIGYGLYEISPNKKYNRISYMIIKNQCNQEVKGRAFEIAPDVLVCDKGLELEINKNRISVTLEPKEEKIILIINENIEDPSIYNHTLVIGIENSAAKCLSYWKAISEKYPFIK